MSDATQRATGIQDANMPVGMSVKKAYVNPEAISINESTKVIDWFYERAKHMHIGNLQAFIVELVNDYEHDIGSILHAMMAGMIATFHAMDKSGQGHITGAMFEELETLFLRKWGCRKKDGWFRVLEYDNMLNPHLEYQFNTITEKLWLDLIEKAKKLLEEYPMESTNVMLEAKRKHWQSIIDGVVPFGYTVVYPDTIEIEEPKKE